MAKPLIRSAAVEDEALLVSFLAHKERSDAPAASARAPKQAPLEK
jgi:hypothetical protein